MFQNLDMNQITINSRHSSAEKLSARSARSNRSLTNLKLGPTGLLTASSKPKLGGYGVFNYSQILQEGKKNLYGTAPRHMGSRKQSASVLKRRDSSRSLSSAGKKAAKRSKMN